MAAGGPAKLGKETAGRSRDSLKIPPGALVVVGDRVEEWLLTGGSDGFDIIFPFLPADLDAFVDRVVPELQRRNLFHTEYDGTTLRDHLALGRPENRSFTAKGWVRCDRMPTLHLRRAAGSGRPPRSRSPAPR